MSEEPKSWFKYPVAKKRYTFRMGEVRQKMVTRIIRELVSEFSFLPHLYRVPQRNLRANGADVIVYVRFNDAVIAKFEVLNWRTYSELGYDHAKSIYNNLQGCPIKGLICSSLLFYKSDERTKELMKRIPVLQLGYQIMPKRWYYLYKKRNLMIADQARPVGKHTYFITKEKIRKFLIDIGFDEYIRSLESLLIASFISLQLRKIEAKWKIHRNNAYRI